MDRLPPARLDGDTAPARNLLAGLDSLVSDLYERGGAAAFGFSHSQFAQILNEVLLKTLAAEDGEQQARDVLSGLHVEELVLARACASGSESAWETFLLRYREPLYEIAYSIARDDRIGRELADGLFSDLYGSEDSEGRRVSKLTSFTGCGSLLGWMRAVMAQAFINLYRSERRLVSLEEDQDLPQMAVPAADSPPTVDPRLEQVTDEVLAALDPEDRFILAAYFLDGRTLAEVARTLKVHESTISRRVEKIIGGMRKKIRDGLIRRGMSQAQAEEALEADVRDLQINVRARLKENLQENAGQPFSKQKAGSNAAGEQH